MPEPSCENSAVEGVDLQPCQPTDCEPRAELVGGSKSRVGWSIMEPNHHQVFSGSPRSAFAWSRTINGNMTVAGRRALRPDRCTCFTHTGRCTDKSPLFLSCSSDPSARAGFYACARGDDCLGRGRSDCVQLNVLRRLLETCWSSDPAVFGKARLPAVCRRCCCPARDGYHAMRDRFQSSQYLAQCRAAGHALSCLRAVPLLPSLNTANAWGEKVK